MLKDEDYQRIESEIASDASPVGIDARKTHVMILGKLESIERRLDRLERQPGASGGIAPGVRKAAENGMAAFTDTLDETVDRLGRAGVDVDARGRHALTLLEKITQPDVLDALSRILDRLEALEPFAEFATHAPHAAAAFTDTFDEAVSRASQSGIEIDAVLRNGLAAILYLGQRISTKELEALGSLLRSDVLHPSAIDVVGRLGCALVAAAEAPRGSVGPLGAVSKLGHQDARRSTAFLLEFARQFGAALNGDGRACAAPIDGGARDV